jgi:predicted RNA-binding Zn-ribbon protein involved in translation (DUF1610 family)
LTNQQIKSLYVFIALHPDGSEMVVGFESQVGIPFQAVFGGELDDTAIAALQETVRHSAQRTGRPVVLRKFKVEDSLSFTCPKCGRVSHNPNDAQNYYCSHCKVFFRSSMKG